MSKFLRSKFHRTAPEVIPKSRAAASKEFGKFRSGISGRNSSPLVVMTFKLEWASTEMGIVTEESLGIIL